MRLVSLALVLSVCNGDSDNGKKNGKWADFDFQKEKAIAKELKKNPFLPDDLPVLSEKVDEMVTLAMEAGEAQEIAKENFGLAKKDTMNPKALEAARKNIEEGCELTADASQKAERAAFEFHRESTKALREARMNKDVDRKTLMEAEELVALSGKKVSLSRIKLQRSVSGSKSILLQECSLPSFFLDVGHCETYQRRSHQGQMGA